MQFTAEVPKVNPIPVPSKPMPVSGQLNKCVHVCVRFFVGGLAAQVPPAKRIAAAEAAEERAEWPVVQARFQGMLII